MKEYFASLFSTPLMAVAQIVGFCAMASAIVCFLQKDRKRIMRWQIIVTCLWTLHFILLGTPTGAAINGMQVVRSLIFINKDTKKWAQWNGWLVIFIVITIVLGVLTRDSSMGIISFLPVIGTTFSNVSLWMKKPLTIRLLTFPVSFTWGVYDFMAKSMAGVCSEIFVVTSLVIAIFTIDLKKKKEPVSEIEA